MGGRVGGSSLRAGRRPLAIDGVSREPQRSVGDVLRSLESLLSREMARRRVARRRACPTMPHSGAAT